MNSKRIISLILSIVMTLQVFAFQTPVHAMEGVNPTSQKSEGQKIGKRSEVFEFQNTEKPKFTWFSARSNSLFGARDVGLTKTEKVKIETTTTGLDEGKKTFNWEAFGQNKKFEAWIEVSYAGEVDKKGEPIRHKVSEDFNINAAGTIETNIVVDASKTVENYYIVTEYDKEPDSFKINAFFDEPTFKSDNKEKSLTIGLGIHQIVSTKIAYNLIDEYGKAIDLTDAKEAKPAVDDLKGIGKIGDVTTFDLKNDGSTNLWQDQELDEWALMDSSLALSLTKTQVTSGDIEYKLTSTYDVINGGKVTIKRQKDVVTPRDPKNPGDIPAGYARINLVADETGNGSKGTFTEDNTTDTTRVVDVRAGKPYTTAQAEINKQGKPFPLTVEKKVDTGKTFKAWAPELSTLGTAADKETKTLNATYQTSKVEIIPYLPGEPEPTQDKDGLPIPRDYVTVTFKSESETKGKVKIGDKEGATVLAKVKPGIDLSQKTEIETAPAEHYGFTKWDPALTKAAAGQTYTAYFVKSGEEIGEKDPIPNGWFKVTVSQDADSIKAGTVPTKYYPVEPGGKLASDKFAELTNKAKDGYKDPAWYVGSDKVEKPYEVVINSSMDFIARATELESHKITKDNGLQAVDFTAYKGDEMDNDFWRKGVKLEKANDSLQKLLDAATVTDATTPARTTEKAGEKTGTLKVTFKDGSTIEVQNQKLTVIDTKVDIDYDKEPNAKDDANAPRHKDEVVKGKIKTSETVEGAKVQILDKDNKLIGTTLANADGSFIAGTRELQAGETIKVIVTLQEAGKASEPVEKVVKLNADRLKDLLPIAKAQKESFNKKQNAFIKKKLEALDTAITEAEKLVDKNYKAVGEDKAENQTAIDNAVTALEKALKELTANIPPSISGPKTHEIFVGQDLDLKKLVDVTDGDGANDLVLENDSNVKITVLKTDVQPETQVTDITTINKTVGTYKITYTAKDKSNAEVTHEMTLTVKPRTTSAIEVTKDPTKMSYLITEKDGKAKLELKGMELNLVDNLGNKTKVELTDKNVKFKVNGKEIKNGGDLILADDVQFIEVEYKDGDNTLTAQTKGVLRVGPDYDGDGTDDRTQNFDPKKIEKLVVVKQPQLDYIAKDKSEDSKFKLNLEGMIVRMTDKAGKEKLAVVSEGKFVDYDNINEEITGLTATPKHGAKLTPETSATETGDNGKTVKITGPNNSEAETDKLKVFYDANKDGKPDYGQEQKTSAPSVMARNVGENPQGTTVEGMATPGAVIKITNKDGTVLTTEPEKVVAGPDGKYTATVKPMLADGTVIKVTAKLGEMEESDPTEAKVFDDKNENKQADRNEGFNIAKATDIKFVDQPDLTYLVASKDKEVTFEGKDGKGKAIYLELSYQNGKKTESKIMTLEDLMKDTTHISVTPENGTKDKIENQTHELVGKAIEVKLKNVVEKQGATEDQKTAATATSTSKFAIEIDADDNGKADKDEKTPAPTAKALNVGKDPKSTTITGKAEKGAKVVAMEGNVKVGETTADAQTGEYTINAIKEGAALPVDTKVNVTAQVGVKKVSDPTEAIVKADKDGNGVADNEENFDITKTAKIEMVSDPNKMDYLVTTQDGTVKFDATGMLVRLTDKAGKEKLYTAAELTADKTNFKVEPAHDADLTIAANNGNKVKVKLLKAPEGMTKTEVETTDKLSVKLDANNNGKPDDQEVFDITKATKVEIIKNPDKMDYLVSKKDGKASFETKGLLIRLTDASGKTATYTAEDLEKDGIKDKFTLSPAKDQKLGLTAEGKTNSMDFTVTVTGATKEEKPTVKADRQVTVQLDADGNGKADKDETTATPTVTARNIGENPTKTTVEGTAPKGSTVTIKYTPAGGEETTKTVTANEQGKYTADITPKLEAGKEVTVTAKDGEKKVSLEVKTQVFDDKDNDGKDDKSQNFDITKADKIEMVYDPAKMNYLVTSKDGKVALETKGMVVKVTDKAGVEKKFTAEEIAKDTKNFTVVPANGTEIGLANNDKPIKVTLNVQGATTKEATTSNLSVKLDANGNGIDDEKEKLDLAKVTGIKIIKQPQLNYPITTEGGKTNINLSDMVVELTDGVNKANYTAQELLDAKVGEDKAFKLELVQGSATAAPTTKDITSLNGIELTTANDGNKVQIALAAKADVKTETEALQVFEDLDGDGKRDSKQTPAPKDLKALNKGSDTFTTITGKATKGDTLKVYGDDKKEIPVDPSNITIDDNGNFTIKVSKDNKALDPNTTVFVTAKAENKEESSRIPVVVQVDKDGNGTADKDERTTIKSVIARNIGTGNTNPKTKATFTTIEGVAEKGSTVTITFTEKGKSEATTKTVEADKTTGAYKLELKGVTEAENILLPADTVVKASAKFGDKKPSGEITTKVFEDLDADGKVDNPNANKTERPSALAYNFKDEAKTTIKGEAEPGAKVIAKVGETKVGEATANSDGKYEISATKDNAKLPKGTKVSVTATLAPKGESPAQETVVYEDLDGDGQPDTSQAFDKDKIRGLEVVASPNKMVYNNKEQLNLTGMKVLLTDQMGNMKIVEFSEFQTYGIKVDPLNNIELSDKNVSDGGHNGKKIKAEVKVAVGNSEKTYSGETPTALVVNKDQSAQPTDVEAANQGTKTTTTVRGKATPGAKVEVKNAKGEVIGTVEKVGNKGEFEVEVTKQADKAKVKVTATEPGKAESAPQEAKVFRDKNGDWKDDKGGKVEIEKPVVDPIKVGDESVKVKIPGEGITKITVKDEKGKTIDVVKDGNDWKVDGKIVGKDGDKLVIPTKDKGLDFGAYEKVEITNNDDEGNEGKIVVATKPANLKPMEKPTIDPISTQSTKITGKSLPGSKVLVYLPGDTDETAREALVKSDGSYELTLATPLADKSLVKVKATNPQREGTGEAETKVGLNLQELEKTDAEADKLINDSKTSSNFDTDNNKYDKNLEEKSKAAKEVLKDAKDKDDSNDPSQTQVNTAEKELRDAINQKGADDKVKVVEKLVKDGQKPSEEDINKAQEAIDKVTDPTAKKELQDRLDKAKALDELKDAKDDLDKVIAKAVEENKPKDETNKAKKESEKADEIIKNGGDGKTAEDLVKEVESIKEITKKLGQPAIQITIDSAIYNGNNLIFTTNPGRCKIFINIYHDDGTEKTIETTTGPAGSGSVLLDKPLQVGDYIEVKATRKLKPTDKPDYLDNSTSTYVY